MNILFPLDTTWRDLRFTGRLARRQPWTVAAVVISIAIGVGANTAVTSVLDTVLLNPLGISNSEHIVSATVHMNKLQLAGSETSAAELRDLQRMTNTFSAVAATEPRAWTIGAGQPYRLAGLAVTPDFFKVFEQRPALGHYLDASDANEVFLSHSLWQSVFGGSRSILGRKVLLDGTPFKVVGVASPDFHFPANVQAWIPLVLTPDRFKRGSNAVLSLFARLKSGVSPLQAQRQVDRVIGNLGGSPEGVDLRKLGYGIDVRTLSSYISGDLRRPLWLLWSAALILLLAACANVAGLLLARAGSRRKEIAIRISLGGSRLQILRQLLTESFLLALLGGAAGLLVAALGLQILRHQPLPYQQTLSLVRLNPRLLFYGLVLAMASSVVFGIIPAVELLREQHVGAMARARRNWFKNTYIVSQVSAAMLLLVLTGLLLKTLKAIEALHPGFEPRNVTTAFLIKPAANQHAFFDRLLSELRASPGVQSAALAYSLPFSEQSPTVLFDIKGSHHQAGEPEWHARAYQVSPDYFKTLQIPLLRGRVILEFDTAGSQPVCVIDAALARRFFPHEDPLGQEIRMYNNGARIVGVVSAIRDTALESNTGPVVYYPLAQIPYFPELGIVVRSSVAAASLIRHAVHSAGPSVPVFDVKTAEERIDASLATRSVIAGLVTVFSGISILLAALGIHALLTQVVSERTAEIGIRMALGARPGDIFRRYLLQGLRLSSAGIAIGLCGAVACRQWFRSFLYQVQPIDAPILMMSVLGFLTVSAIAVSFPSWRASRVDPQNALRSE